MGQSVDERGRHDRLEGALNRNEHERSHENTRHALGRSMWKCDYFNPSLYRYMVAATAADNGARAALYRTS